MVNGSNLQPQNISRKIELDFQKFEFSTRGNDNEWKIILKRFGTHLCKILTFQLFNKLLESYKFRNNISDCEINFQREITMKHQVKSGPQLFKRKLKLLMNGLEITIFGYVVLVLKNVIQFWITAD